METFNELTNEILAHSAKLSFNCIVGDKRHWAANSFQKYSNLSRESDKAKALYPGQLKAHKYW